MSDIRISDSMELALNDQINYDDAEAQDYLSLGVWADSNNYSGIAEFFYKHSEEERQHMFKFLEYIQTRGGEAKIGAIPAPRDYPVDLESCIEDVWQHELDNSKKIYELVDKALEERDWPTFNFLQWFVKEQIEEEALIDGLRDKYALASETKDNNANFYSLDRDMANASQEAELPRDQTL